MNLVLTEQWILGGLAKRVANVDDIERLLATVKSRIG